MNSSAAPAMTSRSLPAISAEVDRVQLAGFLRRAHSITVNTGVPPDSIRQVISDSWRRSVAAGVDPSRPAPRMLDARRTASRLASHPIASVLAQVSEMLGETMANSNYFAAFSDAQGVLLWNDGPARALQTAVAPRFLPGCTCREDRIGTNALGTALVLDAPVQIFSAEHFNQLLHSWICAAAPVHDPDTGELLGAFDLSGEFRSAHAHSLALVTAVARAAEGWLAAQRRAGDERLIRAYAKRWDTRWESHGALVNASGRVLVSEPPGWLGCSVDVTVGSDQWPQRGGTTLRAVALHDGFVVWPSGSEPHSERAMEGSISVLGRNRASVLIDGTRLELGRRHSEIVALLALNPQGMTVRDLALGLYGTVERQSTVRAEIHRLRALLTDGLLTRPYRLDRALHSDVATVAGLLSTGDRSAAADQYPGALLPASVAPGIVAERKGLERGLASGPATAKAAALPVDATSMQRHG